VAEPLSLPSGPPAPLPAEVFRRRRERFLDRIGDGVAIIPAAPELLSSRDTDVPYRPSSDLYYLTGLEEPRTVAVLSGHGRGRGLVLFVRPREPEREVWTGSRLGVDGALAATGAAAVHPIAELDEKLYDLVSGASRILYPIGVDAELDHRVRDLVVRAKRGRPRSGAGPVVLQDVDEVLGGMRRVKGEEELERMRVAARIAAAGHLEAMGAVRPGMGEWELEAVLEATFRRHGAEGPAFPSIVGSGPNATTLHYTANQRRIGEGELVLIDAGAAWGMYASDLTRTFPASGRFRAEQRAVYDVVLAAERAAIAAARPGATVAAMHDAAVRVLAAGLLDLGLVTAQGVDELLEQGGYRRYYMHQTSHWLGLDVHDVGLYREAGAPVPLAPGMVLTVEPGLYLPADDADLPEAFRGIGVRIEDTIAITPDGAEVLTAGVPVEAAEVEALTRSSS
jgi:Xaa-Pro aminopeptidase